MENMALDRELEFELPSPAAYIFNEAPLLKFCRRLAGQLNEGVRIVVEFVYCVNSLDGRFYWPCRVLELEGYNVHLRFESADDNAQSFWAHILCEEIFHAGFSVENQILPRKPRDCFIGQETIKDFVSSCYLGKLSTFPPGLQKMWKEKLSGLPEPEYLNRALNPVEWTRQELKEFLELNNYWGSELLQDVLCDLNGQELITLTEMEVQRRMRHVQDRSSHVSSLVDLINYLRILNWSSNF